MATKFWAFVRDADNKVVQTLSGPDQKIIDGSMQPVPDPVPPSGISVYVIPESDWQLLNAGLNHVNNGPEKWARQPDGSYLEENDTRPILFVTITDLADVPATEFAAGESFKIQFQVQDWQGNNITPNATRKIVFSVNGALYAKRVAVVNGFKEATLSRNETGKYRILNRNADFHVMGTTEFDVYEVLG